MNGVTLLHFYMEQYFPDRRPIPEDPDLAVAALLTATRNYKSTLIAAQYQGTDIGRGHRIEKAHIDQWSAPWFVRTKGREPETRLVDHIADFAQRMQDVILNDAELRLPFGTGKLGMIAERDADRLLILAATTFARMSLGYQAGSRGRGEIVTPSAVLQEVRKSLYWLTQDFTVGKAKRPLIVASPFLPLWKVSHVETHPKHQMLFPLCVLEGKKPEQAIARHLIGPNLNRDVSDASDTYIGKVIQRAMPHLLDTRHLLHIVFLHHGEREKLNRALTGKTDFTPELRREVSDILIAMLMNHREFDIDALYAIRTEIGSENLPDPINGETSAILSTYIEPILPEEGSIATPEESSVLRRRMPILTGKIAMLVDELQMELTPEDRAKKHRELITCVDTMSRICMQMGSDAGPFQTIAKMLTLAYSDESSDRIRTYI